jgi:hypothetical protein
MSGGGYVAIAMVILFVFLIVFVLLLGMYHPRSGADVLDWRPTRSPEVEAQNELDDIDQMLQAQNERRRRKGLPDRTEADVTSAVRAFETEQAGRRESALADEEITQMLEAKNARRRRKGLPEVSLDEFKKSL